MRSFRTIPMLRASTLAVLVTAAVLTGGCDMNTTNPNAPDTKRAFGTPEGLTQLLAGAIQTWVGTRDNYFVLPLTAQADNYTASWNNAAIRFYSSVGSDCASRCGWTNSATAPEAAGGPIIEAQWYGYYSVLNAATLVVSRRVKDGICFDDDCSADSTNTARVMTMAKMLQGFALAGIALVYDQGFILDENSDLTNPTSLSFSTRAQIRDAAMQKLNEAYAYAAAPLDTAWKTESDWMGLGQGQAYSSAQIQQVIRTAQARLGTGCDVCVPGRQLGNAVSLGLLRRHQQPRVWIGVHQELGQLDRHNAGRHPRGKNARSAYARGSLDRCSRHRQEPEYNGHDGDCRKSRGSSRDAQVHERDHRRKNDRDRLPEHSAMQER